MAAQRAIYMRAGAGYKMQKTRRKSEHLVTQTGCHSKRQSRHFLWDTQGPYLVGCAHRPMSATRMAQCMGIVGVTEAHPHMTLDTTLARSWHPSATDLLPLSRRLDVC